MATWTSKDVRFLLRKLRRPAELENDELGRALAAATRAPSVRAAILTAINRALGDDERPLAAVVRRCNVEGAKTNAVAAELHISTRQLFRYRDAALAALRFEFDRVMRERRHTLRPTDAELDAAELYARGRQLWRKRTAPSIRAALAMYERALQLDPSFTLAHVGLADVHLIAAEYLVREPGAAFRAARAALARAREIDRDVPSAHASDADLAFFAERDAGRAHAAIDRALGAAPARAHTYNNAAWYCLLRGEYDDALAHVRRLLELDPGGPEPHLLLGLVQSYRGDAARAIETLSYARGFEAARDAAPYRLGVAQIYANRYADGIATLSGEPLTQFPQQVLGYAGYAEAVLGDRRAAEARLRTLDDLRATRFVSAYWTALIDTGLGRRSNALDALERVEHEGDTRVHWIAIEPCFATLRGTTRFDRITRAARTPLR